MKINYLCSHKNRIGVLSGPHKYYEHALQIDLKTVSLDQSINYNLNFFMSCSSKISKISFLLKMKTPAGKERKISFC